MLQMREKQLNMVYYSPMWVGQVFLEGVSEICVSQTYFAILITPESTKSLFQSKFPTVFLAHSIVL